MKHINTFESFLNEAASTFVEDSGNLKTKAGSLKYKVLGGLDRGGNRGSYQINNDKLAALINTVDTKTISEILGTVGIEMAARLSEFELSLTNSGLGYNGLSAIIPEITIPVKLSKDYPQKERGWVITKEEYEIYSKLNAELEKATKGKGYGIRFKNENSNYGSSIKNTDPKITIAFEQGSLE
jgi:hypothetical protein